MTQPILPPARLLVLGASRGIGRACVTRAARDGYSVRAVSRAPGAAPESALVEPFAADATDPEAMRRAVEGCDAVVMALGLPLNVSSILDRVTLFSRATEAVCAAMDAAGCRRIVAITGFGTSESRAAVSSVEKLAFRGVMGRIYDDKTRQEDILRGSGLDWTIARPVILTNGRGTGRYAVLTTRKSWRNGLIPRADVADFAIRAIAEGTYVHEAPVLAR